MLKKKNYYLTDFEISLMMFASNLLAVLVGSLNLPVQYYMVPVRSYTVTHYLVCTQVFDLTRVWKTSLYAISSAAVEMMEAIRIKHLSYKLSQERICSRYLYYSSPL
jgi:hypothetical protein